MEESLKQFFKIRIRQAWLLPPLILITVLEALVSAIRQEKKTKWIKIVKEANLFIPICCSQKFYKKHLEMINNFSRVTEYKINLKKPFNTPTAKMLRKR